MYAFKFLQGKDIAVFQTQCPWLTLKPVEKNLRKGVNGAYLCAPVLPGNLHCF
jgi:hypothetical protein